MDKNGFRMTNPKRWVEAHPYYHPDQDQPDTLWEVRQETPETWPNGTPWRGTGCWGDSYRIACYSDKAAAEEHARTGRKPRGYR